MVSAGLQRDDWVPQGERVGWVDAEDLYLLPDAAFAAAQRMAGTQEATIGVGQRTLWKRMTEAGMVASREIERGRHIVRRVIGGTKYPVLHIKLCTLYAERKGPSGPDDPEGQETAPPGPFAGADLDDEGRKGALKDGPNPAEIGDQGPEGPKGPVSDTQDGKFVETEL